MPGPLTGFSPVFPNPAESEAGEFFSGPAADELLIKNGWPKIFLAYNDSTEKFSQRRVYP